MSCAYNSATRTNPARLRPADIGAARQVEHAVFARRCRGAWELSLAPGPTREEAIRQSIEAG